ncbi:hypothetical protein BH11PSE3_BH11PSE3_48640 [soil metagenome]
MLACGLIGLMVTPIVVGLVVLAAAHLLDSRCGTPGDSGGCEMGVAAIALASALPGMAVGLCFPLFQAYRKRRRPLAGAPGEAPADRLPG